MDERSVDRSFQRFLRRGDVEALGRVFDEAAPELLGIAFRLTGGIQDAEDVVQATFVTTIERAERFDKRSRTLPWMLGILLNHARTLRRSRGRFGSGAALEDANLPGPEDVGAEVEEIELTSFVERALERLPDSYRSVVARHVRRGLRPREIAAELDITANVARVRLYRGLERLRQLLPAGLSGAAVASLTPSAKAAGLANLRPGILEAAGRKAVLLKSGASASLPAGLSWPKLVAAGLLGWIVPVLALPLLQQARADTEVVTTVSVEPVSEEAEPQEFVKVASLAKAEPERATPERVNVITPVRVAGSETPLPENVRPDEPAIVMGRLLFPDGRPAADTPVQLEGYLRSEEPRLPTGSKEAGRNQEEKSDGAGRFRFSFDPPGDSCHLLRVKPEEHAPAQWVWNDLPVGAMRDIGDVMLEEGGTLEIRVNDRDGKMLGPDSRGYTVNVSAGVPSGQGRTATTLQAERQDDGTFRVEHVPSGTCGVAARFWNDQVTEEQTLELENGETRRITLELAGPDPAQRISVFCTFPQGGYVTVRPEDLRIYGRSLYGEPAQYAEESLSAFNFDGLEDGFYRIELEDERFLPWSADNVTPGEPRVLSPRGSSALRLRVYERKGGEQLKHYAAQLNSEEELHGEELYKKEAYRASPQTILLKTEKRAQPDGDRFEGIIPGVYSLQIEVEGHPDQVQRVALLSSETKELDVILERKPPLAPQAGADEPGYGAAALLVGSLRFPEGASLEGFKLELVESMPIGGGSSGDKKVRGTWTRTDTGSIANGPVSTVKLDPDGRFEAGPLPAKPYVLRLRRTTQLSQFVGDPPKRSLHWCDLITLDLKPGKSTFELDIHKHMPGTIELSTGMSGVALDGWTAYVGSHTRSGSYPVAATSAERFVIDDLFPDSYRIDLAKRNGWAPSATVEQRVTPMATTQVELDLEIVRGETLLLSQESGQPLVNRRIYVRFEEETSLGSRSISRSFDTDAEGKLALELKAGAYYLSKEKPEKRGAHHVRGRTPHEVEVRWIHAGLIPSRLEL